MPDIQYVFRRYMKYHLYILAIFVLGWGFTEYQTEFASLILGTAASFYNVWNLYIKTVRFSDAVASGRKVYSLGSLSRMAIAALVVLISIRFTDYFNAIFSIIGLTTSYIVILIDSLIMFVFKKGKQQEER